MNCEYNTNEPFSPTKAKSTHYDYSYLESYIARITRWNVRAGNAPSQYGDERIDQIVLQSKLVGEELQELIDAIKASDLKEQVDAVCDLIVVGSYMGVLTNTPLKFDTPSIPPVVITDSYVTGLDTENPPIDRLVYILGAALVDAGIEVNRLMGTVIAITQSLWHVYARDYGEGYLRQYMEEVLKTNDAKFIQGYDDAVAGLPEVKQKYAGKFDNIVVKRCPSVAGDSREFYCYRADSGKGKILKPVGWVEPMQEQDQDV